MSRVTQVRILTARIWVFSPGRRKALIQPTEIKSRLRTKHLKIHIHTHTHFESLFSLKIHIICLHLLIVSLMAKAYFDRDWPHKDLS